VNAVEQRERERGVRQPGCLGRDPLNGQQTPQAVALNGDKGIPAIQVGEIGREKMFVQPTTCPSRKFSLQLTGLSPSSCRTVELSSSGEGNRLQTIHNKYSRM
jgi:hypothetical protein